VRLERLISPGLVCLQFALCTALVLLAPWYQLSPDELGVPGFALRPIELTASVWAGLVCMAFGSLLGLWAWGSLGLTRLRIMPEPGATAELITTGPYRWVRHPMYLGVLLLMFGFVLLNPNWLSNKWLSILLWMALVGVLNRKAAREERFLEHAFPNYAKYRQHTGRFIPPL